MSRFIDVELWECTDEEYFEGGLVGSSTIARALGYPPPSKKAGKGGRLNHLATFEPDKFDALVKVPPEECQRGSGPGQQTRLREWEADQPADALIVTPAEYETAKRLRDRLHSHPVFTKSVRRPDALFEQSIRAKDDATGLDIRIRVDALVTSVRAIWDLKSVKDPDFGKFCRGLMGPLVIQAALYHDVVLALTGTEHRFAWLAAGKEEARCLVGTYVCTEAWLEIGRRMYSAGLQMIAAERQTKRPSEPWWCAKPLQVEEPPPWVDAELQLHEKQAEALWMEAFGQ